jgi:4-hydroxy-3-methylbut-2-enyl diphosphate reductase
MKILFPRAYGMCFGVRDALLATEQIDRPQDVTIYGELVHNEAVRARLQSLGFADMPESGRAVPSTPAVLVTAHGISGKERAQLASAGLQILDTTCPLVRNAHSAALTLDAEGRLVVVVGKPGHVEVRGITGDLRKYVVIESAGEAARYDTDRIGVVAQTTTHPEHFHEVVARIVELNPGADVRVADTICKPTRDRQEGLAELLYQIDALVVVGGRQSRNTRELAETGRRAGVRVLHVESPGEIDPRWFDGVQRCGLAAGTSTLPETIDAVHRRLLEIARSMTRVAPLAAACAQGAIQVVVPDSPSGGAPS